MFPTAQPVKERNHVTVNLRHKLTSLAPQKDGNKTTYCANMLSPGYLGFLCKKLDTPRNIPTMFWGLGAFRLCWNQSVGVTLGGMQTSPINKMDNQ